MTTSHPNVALHPQIMPTYQKAGKRDALFYVLNFHPPCSSFLKAFVCTRNRHYTRITAPSPPASLNSTTVVVGSQLDHFLPLPVRLIIVGHLGKNLGKNSTCNTRYVRCSGGRVIHAIKSRPQGRSRGKSVRFIQTRAIRAG